MCRLFLILARTFVLVSKTGLTIGYMALFRRYLEARTYKPNYSFSPLCC